MKRNETEANMNQT